MIPNLRSRAFTLIELLVVVAIIALLLSILLPSLAGAREQGKRAKCLANLKNLGNATQLYAVEDRSETLFPKHHLFDTFPTSPPSGWQFLVINWWASWGGASSTRPFDARGSATGTSGDRLWWLNERDPNFYGVTGVSVQAPDRFYDSKYRPLNKIVLPGGADSVDARKLEWYRCPSDSGYPLGSHIDDFPPTAFNLPIFPQLGNSYRASLISRRDAGYTWQYTVGPAAQRSSAIPSPGRVVLLGEPQFFNMIGKNSTDAVFGSTEPNPPSMVGWHRQNQSEQILYCDGSARLTRAMPPSEGRSLVTSAMILQWRIASGWEGFIRRRGPNYQLDVYPRPGGFIYGNSTSLAGTAGAFWPFSAGLGG